MAETDLNAFLERRPAPCPLCRRLLSHADDGRCHHCGAPLALGLALVDGYRVPWGAALSLLASAAGFTGFIALMDLLAGAPPRPPFQQLAMGALGFSSVLFAWASVAITWKRRPFCAMHRPTQWAAVLAAALALAAVLLIFVWAMH
jgi:hypothetical protein